MVLPSIVTGSDARNPGRMSPPPRPSPAHITASGIEVRDFAIPSPIRLQDDPVEKSIENGALRNGITDVEGSAGMEEAEMKDELSREAEIVKLKEAKKASVTARNLWLEQEVLVQKNKLEAVKGELRNKDAAATVKRHIQLLHRYNEMRDIGQGLLGLLAEQRNVTVREIYEEFGVGRKD